MSVCVHQCCYVCATRLLARCVYISVATSVCYISVASCLYNTVAWCLYNTVARCVCNTVAGPVVDESNTSSGDDGQIPRRWRSGRSQTVTAAKTISTISASSVCALCVCVEGEKQDPDKQILCSKCDMASTAGYWTRPSHMFLMMRTGVCVCMCGCIWVYVDLVTF